RRDPGERILQRSLGQFLSGELAVRVVCLTSEGRRIGPPARGEGDVSAEYRSDLLGSGLQDLGRRHQHRRRKRAVAPKAPLVDQHMPSAFVDQPSSPWLGDPGRLQAPADEKAQDVWIGSWGHSYLALSVLGDAQPLRLEPMPQRNVLAVSKLGR